MAPSLGNWPNPVPIETSWAREPTPRKHILYIDAYDSFSYNVVAMLEETLNARVSVLMIDSTWPKNDMISFIQHFEAVVLGPGPGHPGIPADVGIMADIWDLADSDVIPVFGICLGFQSLCLRYGMRVGRLPFPLHGQVRGIETVQRDIFEGVQDVEVTLYHSLYARLSASVGGRDDGNVSLDELDLLAWLSLEDDGSSAMVPMAARHKSRPLWGVQFHPESCKSDKDACTRLLRRWWQMALKFNKRTGRGGHVHFPYNLDVDSTDTFSLPDAAYTMLDWCASTSKHAGFRSLSTRDLTAEMICEKFNTPNSPTVMFQDSGRYNIVSVPSPDTWRLEYNASSGRLTLVKPPSTDEVLQSRVSVPRFWDALRYVMEMKRVSSGNPDVPFWAGFLGYFSYEMGLACLSHPKTAESDARRQSHQPTSGDVEDPSDVSVLWTDRSIVIDNATGSITIQSIRGSDDSPSGWLDQTAALLEDLSAETPIVNSDVDSKSLDTVLKEGEIAFPDEHNYKQQVEACKAELEAGESYELCLTCETSIVLPPAGVRFPWELYKRLKKYNPAAFSAFARLGNIKIVSSSPECFLTWDRTSTLEMKPMKGTVKKSVDMTMEKAKKILGSTKEMAENLMIADLIRHDLYGICGSGGVRVEKLLEVEDHGRVYQMITHVKGEVDHRRPGVAVRDIPQLQSSNMSAYGVTALQKCLPPGSMTGAPKERSCMHLQAIEARKRGIYSGVMGYLDLGGGGSFSVLIRTAFSSSKQGDEKQTWRIGAGGAVTTLSTAEGEWDEMLTKLRTVCNIFTPMDSKA